MTSPILTTPESQDWDCASEAFRKLIERDAVVVQPAVAA